MVKLPESHLKPFESPNSKLIVHFTVTSGNKAGVDLVLIQLFLLYDANHVILMLSYRPSDRVQ